MNYTKGEWKVSNKSFGGAKTDGNLVVWSPNGIVAMACTINEGLVNAEANAHLIAAAPDMYEALKRLLKKMPDCGGCIKTETAILEAQEALAKAERKQ